MRSNEIKIGSVYAYKPASSYGKATQVRVIATKLPRLVSGTGYRKQLSEMKDGVLVESVDGSNLYGGTERDTRKRVARPQGGARFNVVQQFEHLPAHQTIVRTSEIVGEWDQYEQERDEARKVAAERRAARKQAERRHEQQVEHLQGLLGAGRVRKSVGFDTVLSHEALEALLAKLEEV